MFLFFFSYMLFTPLVEILAQFLTFSVSLGQLSNVSVP